MTASATNPVTTLATTRTARRTRPARRTRTARALAALTATPALLLAACSSGGDDAPTPTFSASTTSARATTTTSAPATTTSSTSTPAASPSGSAGAEPSGTVAVDPTASGPLTLTTQQPGRGTPKTVEKTFQGLEDRGFRALTVSLYDEKATGFLQFPVTRDVSLGSVTIAWKGVGLGGSGTCSVTARILDEQGNDVTRLRSSDDSGINQSCSSVESFVVDTPGPRTVDFEIRQAGYEPVRVSQPITVVS
ncbi:hypothetical protein QP948_09875 [Corynebacterium bovis]|uniref:hypothetical protein n=1 Tax=Corynebacterium bovis TaxID=36808 RepID=UPI00254E89E6|nr:hypothetical protein [Corynebacterium bovis]MDK8511693.1 hypothetical protein [Corynebacterium bovis]